MPFTVSVVIFAVINPIIASGIIIDKPYIKYLKYLKSKNKIKKINIKTIKAITDVGTDVGKAVITVSDIPDVTFNSVIF